MSSLSYDTLPEEHRTLYRFLLNEGPMSSSQISNRTGIAQARLNCILYVLKVRGLVRSVFDRRSLLVMWEAF